MNVTKSRALLLTLCVFFSAITLMAKTDTLGKNKDTSKELIIVTIDQQLTTQLDALARYVHGKYKSMEGSMVTIKTYMNGDHESIDKLVLLLEKQGISREDIAVTDGGLRLDNPYFTMSVAAQPVIQ